VAAFLDPNGSGSVKIIDKKPLHVSWVDKVVKMRFGRKRFENFPPSTLHQNNWPLKGIRLKGKNLLSWVDHKISVRKILEIGVEFRVGWILPSFFFQSTISPFLRWLLVHSSEFFSFITSKRFASQHNIVEPYHRVRPRDFFYRLFSYWGVFWSILHINFLTHSGHQILQLKKSRIFSSLISIFILFIIIYSLRHEISTSINFAICF